MVSNENDEHNRANDNKDIKFFLTLCSHYIVHALDEKTL